jgi:hypothetical protein
MTFHTMIDASYHVAVHLAKRFQMRRFLEMDQPETRITYGSHVCYIYVMYIFWKCVKKIKVKKKKKNFFLIVYISELIEQS